MHAIKLNETMTHPKLFALFLLMFDDHGADRLIAIKVKQLEHERVLVGLGRHNLGAEKSSVGNDLLEVFFGRFVPLFNIRSVIRDVSNPTSIRDCYIK